MGQLNPSTGVFDEWTIPTSDSLPNRISVSGGLVYFTEYFGNKIGQLNPATGVFTEWTVPTGSSRPGGITVAGGLVYFTEYSGNKISELNPSTGVFTEWAIPTGSSGPLGIAVSGSSVYFSELLGNKIGQLNPSTGVFNEWTIPTSSSNPYGISVAGGLVYFIESNGNKIGQLNPSTGVFNEWTIPTSNSIPAYLFVSGDSVYFTEDNGNKIGLFTLSPVATLITSIPVTFSTVTTESSVSTASDGFLATSTATAASTSTSSVTESTTSAVTQLSDTLTVPTSSSTISAPPAMVSELHGFTSNSTGSILLVIGDFAINPHGTKCCGVGFQSGRDTTPAGFISGMLTNPQPTEYDTNAAWVTQATGRPAAAVNTVFVIGGDLINAASNYYQTTSFTLDRAPVGLTISGGNYIWTDRNGTTVLTIPQSSTAVPPGSSDVFTIEVLQDSGGRFVVLMFGTTYMGTWAAAYYYKYILYPNISTYTNGYYIIRWTDATTGPSANGVPDSGDTYTTLATAPS